MARIKMILSFGPMAPKISEQLAGKLSLKAAEAFDADAFELCRLQIRGLLTDGEARKARQRLVKMIEKALKKNAPESETASISPLV